jgi:hypothetical protein
MAYKNITFEDSEHTKVEKTLYFQSILLFRKD